jgi:SAM-dependent methyltransferase
MSICPLCESKSDLFYQKGKTYHICRNCKGIFLNKDYFLSPVSEKLRYETHNNDVNDSRYQEFVSPITINVLNDFNNNHIGLDFGAGTGPVISKILKDNNFQIKQYDPFFFNDKSLLNSKYDYIVSCEVVEHFHNPKKEFELLSSILNKSGKLYIMTDIYDSSINFEKWYYKNDPTHVFLYQNTTFEYIKDSYNFNDCKIQDRLIILDK